MNYTKINLILKNPLSFWANFSESERFFWYDRQKNQLIIGTERLSTVTEAFEDYPYLFHTQTFFEQVDGQLWRDFGGETLAFKNYFVKTAQESFYLTTEKPREIQELEFLKTHHQLTEKPGDFTAWTTIFNQIQDNFAQGKSQKIVASRELTFESQTLFNIESILQNLIDNNPGCFIFAYQKGARVFLGASPEILVQKNGEQILSYALAGTMPKSVKNAGELLLHDPKNLHEHEIVVKKIQKKMLEHSKEVTVDQTSLMELKNVYHLRTLLTAQNSKASLIDWAKALHPTPALGGEPKQAALDFLRQYETHERGLYAAPIGLVDAQGNGTVVVGIRSALIDGQTLHAYAGCGIVPNSDVQDEFNETKIKLKTILEAL